MLDYMRQRSRSLVIYFFFTILIFVFVFQFGSQSEGWNPSEVTVAASVGGDAIEGSDIEMEFTRHYGWSFARNQELSDVLAQKRALLDDLIKVRVLARLAGQLGLVATERDLRDYILDERRNIDRASFATDGKFDPELYRRVVISGYRSSLKRYERNRRQDLLSRRLLEFLAAQPRAFAGDVEDEWRIRNTNVNLEYVAFQPGMEAEPAPPTAEEVAAFAKETEAGIKAYFESHKADYDRPREVRIRQIFKKADAEDAAARETARKAAEDLRARLGEGDDMAALAKEHSDHFSYKEQGGDMGWQTKGNADPAFDDAAFSLEAGQLSEVVETPTGYFVLRAEEIREAVKRGLDEVSDEIATTLLVEDRRRQAARARAAEALAKARAGTPLAELVAAAGTPEDGEEAAGGANYAVEETGPFTQEGGMGDPDPLNPFRFQRAWDTIPRIGRSAALSRAAFALTVEAPWPTEPVEVDGTPYVFTLKERIDPDPAELDAKRDELRRELSEAKAALLLGPWDRALFARAFQRRLFGKEPKLGLWLDRVLKQRWDDTSIDVDETLFALRQDPAAPPEDPPADDAPEAPPPAPGE